MHQQFPSTFHALRTSIMVTIDEDRPELLPESVVSLVVRWISWRAEQLGRVQWFIELVLGSRAFLVCVPWITATANCFGLGGSRSDVFARRTTRSTGRSVSPLMASESATTKPSPPFSLDALYIEEVCEQFAESHSLSASDSIWLQRKQTWA